MSWQLPRSPSRLEGDCEELPRRHFALLPLMTQPGWASTVAGPAQCQRTTCDYGYAKSKGETEGIYSNVSKHWVDLCAYSFDDSRSPDGNNNPIPPPKRANNILSVNNCLISCTLPAPIAARIVISLYLLVSRANKRLATFAQATSRTKITDPKTSHNVRRAFPTVSSVRETTFAPRPLFVVGCSRSRR